jgi:hypothetical protein
MSGNKKLYILFTLIAFLFCVGAPIITTLAYFPLFIEHSAEKTFSGGVLVLLLLCAVPLFNVIKKAVKKAPVKWIWLIWGILFGILYLLQPIIEELMVVSLVGAAGGLIAIIFFTLARKHKPLEEVIRE